MTSLVRNRAAFNEALAITERFKELVWEAAELGAMMRAADRGEHWTGEEIIAYGRYVVAPLLGEKIYEGAALRSKVAEIFSQTAEVSE